MRDQALGEQRMTTNTAQPDPLEQRGAVVDWLLDSDPAIRWQVKSDLMHERNEVVARERSRVATEGWGAQLLDLQGSDGHWGGGSFVPRSWASTMETLMLLKNLGLDPASQQAQRATALVRDQCTWGAEFGDSPFFEGEVEPCINGRVLGLGAYFGQASQRLLERLLSEQLPDGGWNCEAPPSKRSSFHTTICVLEGLLEFEKAKGTTTPLRDARIRGQEYLMERGLFRSLSTRNVIDPDWARFSFPPHWHYDVLRGLDYLRKAGVEPDERLEEALELVEKKRDNSGRWVLENPHAGKVHFDMEEGADKPSRWNTLRATCVLDWYSKPD